ncbi:MAG: phosphate ABC transporter, permease protein PstA [Candidatus Raymondbacteria bacterium RifOxyA12_full_50_37]|uniref:Phosphate transport system permease protein PstA n=1 Tax=Candidatus Raymondbacteria bacterium RIFOXYD12_FULL_49_13 TaxID=1817890 RepID=A0A1F7F1P4_UNCRA|nr:MAG: phosphate ABC transporter, permease protein PstA [Candidatus Raymondbacteria bacterium RifOxyA12_full_50_37]OGJ90069.1 MAG: phosphate ABC transporter, permease protein PstA [Candidatus Raymondbacteria bacterium RIFOXYA2_FULL_49_16]OGJ96711.1 MAG: phosphate ABC transporter, permease protein PstA [Candidatus Raymondbacteria bacterium RifOxyB12_full_50_8]OGJ96754.1 MAG: phosphate ABC transporter, permease protein PstA [Candidatus Raymondbacteria bacterium RIFOXYC2_FULL_50_21]OGK00551.1 MAG
MTKKRFLDIAVPAVTGLCVLFVIVAIGAIMINIIVNGWSQISLKFLTSAPEEGMTAGGIFPAIMGTFYRTIIMSLVGVPVGTLTAIFLCEYVSANSPLLRMVRFAVNTLAGIPSIVFGLFGLGFFVQFVGPGMDSIFSAEGQIQWAQPNILWASLTMAVLTLPVVIVSVEESIRTVPHDIREASLALGATRWQTIWRVVVPNSITGILTGAVLAVSRGAGEVAPILFTGAAYFLPNLTHSLSDQFMDLGYHVYIMSTQSPDVDATRGIQYGTTLVLLCLTFTLNAAAIILRYRMRKRVNA